MEDSTKAWLIISVQKIAELTHASPDEIIDGLTGIAWDEEDAFLLNENFSTE